MSLVGKFVFGLVLVLLVAGLVYGCYMCFCFARKPEVIEKQKGVLVTVTILECVLSFLIINGTLYKWIMLL